MSSLGPVLPEMKDLYIGAEVKNLPTNKKGKVRRKKRTHRENFFPAVRGEKYSPESLKNLSRTHFGAKFPIFGATAASVYNTGRIFTRGPTYTQAQSAKRGRNACHSGILPHITANDKFVYMKGSSLEAAQNATVDLPRKYNNADSKIEKELRSPAIKLLNRVAMKEITPIKAQEELMKMHQKFLADQEDPILKRYSGITKDLLAEFNREDMLKQFGLMIEKPKDEKVIYHSRLKHIQENLSLQSKISSITAKLFNEIRKGMKKRPPYLREAVNYLLIDAMKGKDRLRMLKREAIPPKEYHFPAGSRQEKSLTKKMEKNKSNPLIDKSAKKISKLMEKMRKRDEERILVLMAKLRGKAHLPEKVTAASIKEWCKANAVHESAFNADFFYA